jgi:hypothetical protein
MADDPKSELVDQRALLLELEQYDDPGADDNYKPDLNNAHVRRANWKPSPPKPKPTPRIKPLPVAVRRIAWRRPWLTEGDLRRPFDVYERERDNHAKFRRLNLTTEARHERRNMKRKLERASKIEARGWHNAKWFNRDRTPDHVALELGKVYYRATRKLPSYTRRPDGTLGGAYVDLVSNFLTAVEYVALSNKQLRLMIDGRPDEKGIRELIEILVTKGA